MANKEQLDKLKTGQVDALPRTERSQCARWMLIFLGNILLSTTRVDARPYTQLYVFGGRYEDIGNNWQGGKLAPENGNYATGRQCNGAVQRR